MIVMIDNYDSFTYNIVQYFGKLGSVPKVFRNDEVSVKELENMNPSALVISPGPCTPKEAGISVEAIRAFHGKIPILGVCLGHQCIGYAFGAKIVRAKRIMHGKSSLIEHDGEGLFEGLSLPFSAVRYHSLVIQRQSLPEDFEVCAVSEDDNEIMAIRHRRFLTFGVQFHPESIMTQDGLKIIENFLKFVRQEG